MIFWIVFFCSCFLCLLINECFNEYIASWGERLLYLIVFFITAFRYNIGWDYQPYIKKYIEMEWSSIDDVLNGQVEFVYYIIVNILKDCGFDSQMFFFVYALLTLSLFYFANKKYFSSYKARCIAFLIFLFSPHLYMESLNIVRQMLAVALIYFAYGYWEKGKRYTYCLFTILATLVHLSAAIGMVIPFIPRKKFNITLYLICFGMFIYIYQMDIVFKIIGMWAEQIGIDVSIIKYAKYLHSNEQTLPVFMIGFDIMVFIFIYLFSGKQCGKFLNMMIVVMGFFICVSYSHELMRVAYYFLIFYIIPFCDALINVPHRSLRIFTLGVLMIYSLLLINGNMEARLKLTNVPSSAYNYEYDYNLSLIK